jgi:hypothetical protein
MHHPNTTTTLRLWPELQARVVETQALLDKVNIEKALLLYLHTISSSTPLVGNTMTMAGLAGTFLFNLNGATILGSFERAIRSSICIVK